MFPSTSRHADEIGRLVMPCVRHRLFIERLSANCRLFFLGGTERGIQLIQECASWYYVQKSSRFNVFLEKSFEKITYIEPENLWINKILCNIMIFAFDVLNILSLQPYALFKSQFSFMLHVIELYAKPSTPWKMIGGGRFGVWGFEGWRRLLDTTLRSPCD